MEITLRKADQLAHRVFDVAKKISVTPMLNLSVHDKVPVAEQVQAARQKTLHALSELIEINSAGFAIRSLIKSAMATSGIDTLLTEKKALEQQTKLISSIAVERDQENDDRVFTTLTTKLNSLRVRLEATQPSRYGDPEEHVSINVLGAHEIEQIDEKLTGAQDRLTLIADDLMQKNWNTKIHLSDDIARVLKKHKIKV